MAISEKKEKQLKKMPRVESFIEKTKDGKFLMHKTVITDIKPLEYYVTVVNNTIDVAQEAQNKEGEAAA